MLLYASQSVKVGMEHENVRVVAQTLKCKHREGSGYQIHSQGSPLLCYDQHLVGNSNIAMNDDICSFYSLVMRKVDKFYFYSLIITRDLYS